MDGVYTNAYISGMDKKLRDKMLPKRFNSKDVEKWQKAANEQTGGNLTLWMELVLNEAAKKPKKLHEPRLPRR